MVRSVIYLLLSLVLITFLRMVIGMILRGMKEMMSPNAAPHAGVRGQPPNPPISGELKRDPVCGTFVPANTSFRKSVNGESYCFCSADCRDKYAG
jgi:YHS domain-containing protein